MAKRTDSVATELPILCIQPAVESALMTKELNLLTPSGSSGNVQAVCLKIIHRLRSGQDCCDWYNRRSMKNGTLSHAGRLARFRH